MRRTIVLDTSIVIDLSRGAMVDALFGLGHRFVVPDLLYRQELEDWIGQHLMTLGMEVLMVRRTGMWLVGEYARRQRSLSTADVLALALAKDRKFDLLTGDGDLRCLGEEESVQCNGLLAAFDWIEQAGLMQKASLHSSLLTISNHGRARLPLAEVRARLRRYNGDEVG